VDLDDLRLSPAWALASERWQLVNPDSIGWREWEGDVVVHVGSRADTHLLSAAAGAVLIAFLDSREALTLPAAFERTFGGAEVPAVPMSEAEHDSLRAIAQDLERIGLLTRSTS
jgi:hypothetical protein